MVYQATLENYALKTFNTQKNMCYMLSEKNLFIKQYTQYNTILEEKKSVYMHRKPDQKYMHQNESVYSWVEAYE